MVQKQAANSIRSQSDSFADDDPLAELARIVGFDQPLKREPVMSLPQVPVSAESDFNLEDELLREFSVYGAPASHQVEDDRFYEAPEPVAPRFEPAPQSYEAPRAEPDFANDGAFESVSLDVEPEVSFGVAGDASRDEPSFALDLADELEMAVAEVEAPPAPQRVEKVPRLRLPLANFAPAPRVEPVLQPAAAPQAVSVPVSSVVAPDVVEPASVRQATVQVSFDKPAFDWSAVAVEPAVEAEDVVVPELGDFSFDFSEQSDDAVPVSGAAGRSLGQGEPDFGFSFSDDMIRGPVDKIEPVAPPVVAPAAAAPAEIAPVAASQALQRPPLGADEEFDPFADHDFDLQLDELDLDLSEIEPVAEGPVAAAQVAPIASAQAFVSAVNVTSARVEPSAPAVTVSAPVVRSVPQPDVSFAPAVPSQPQYQPQPAMSDAVRPEPVRFEPVRFEPVRSEPVPAKPLPAEPAARAVPEYEDSVGFDPAEIAEQDEQIESFSGMDVPEVPMAEARPQAAPQADYDFDIDSELATLFNEPVASPPPATPLPSAGRVAVETPVKPAAAQPPLDEFEAFERALEEDFRTSLNSTQTFERETRGHITIAGEAQGFRRIKPYLMAGTAAVVLLLGAGGLYAWLGTGSVGTLTSGEPQVIAADKDPVKIVPENPGGKSVPNQDKAVYDRVAGNGVEDPKQTSLISSEEEPMDVVQRTLIPENLPMENEGQDGAIATPVGETEDPRLLPDGQPAETAAAAEDPGTITPRKVRTMIVRPDGTLVAQDVPEVATQAQSAAAPQAGQQPATPVLAAPSQPSTNTTDVVKPIETSVVPPVATSTASAPVETAAVAPVETPAAEMTGTPDPKAPIPTSRPAQQPVNVVSTVTDQGNVRPAPAPAATETQTAPTETAAVAPATPTPPAATAPAAPAASGSYAIQIASLPSEADAQKSYRNLSGKFASVLGGQPFEIRKADIPGKGTFYRVRVGAGSKAEAVALCEKYRAAGGSCLVSK
ncbi:SPOR domain-containing protein [Rhizobium sp. SL42]|uniref:SPOR domain-containing protein n=1 Tax=Rhizobium sp. SL42 TaxID=2806346 RepID=UPI001EFF87CE|nr:SPOR domain-containing protein [Rhizobium sp. SL42]UJW73499.1 SPOR domain-containing protein [Rhizobium sp. SL42]